MDISAQINLLIELQKLDAEIYSLRKRKAGIPEIIKGLEGKFKAAGVILKNIEDEIKSLQLRQKDKENELGAKEEQIKKCQAQLYQLKTNKEYTTMEQEINGHKADKSTIEDDILTVLDKIEEKKGEAEKSKTLISREQNKINDEKKKADNELKDIEAKLAGLEAERSKTTPKIGKSMLGKYERLLKGKDGLAMVPVRGDACGGCHLNLPPQVINEIRMKKELVFCESCSRILFFER